MGQPGQANAPAAAPAEDLAFYRAEMEKLYAVHNPSKLEDGSIGVWLVGLGPTARQISYFEAIRGGRTNYSKRCARNTAPDCDYAETTCMPKVATIGHIRTS